MINVQKIRKDFPILSRRVKGKPLVYLDNAATSQKPKAVIEAIREYYQGYNANIHRGIHTLAEEATSVYEEARKKVAKFIGAAKPAEIVFTRGTTESINLVAYSWARANLKAGDTILLTVMEHHSNLVPWQLLSQEIGFKLEFINLTDDGYLEKPEETVRRVKPKLLAFTHVSNVLGTINLVKKLAKVGHEVGAMVLVDGAQAVPHLPVNVRSLGADFYAFSAHKMLGPTGVGVLYAKERLFKEIPPFLGGGEMIKEVHLRKATFNEPPHKFEAGTPNIAGVIGLGAAVDYLSSIGMKEIRKYEEELTDYALEELQKVDNLTVYGPKEPASQGGVITLNVEGIHPHDLATVLNEEGIAVRSGHHCAMPLHDYLGLTATARVSFSLYNTVQEIHELVRAVKEAKKVFK